MVDIVLMASTLYKCAHVQRYHEARSPESTPCYIEDSTFLIASRSKAASYRRIEDHEHNFP